MRGELRRWGTGEKGRGGKKKEIRGDRRGDQMNEEAAGRINESGEQFIQFSTFSRFTAGFQGCTRLMEKQETNDCPS